MTQEVIKYTPTDYAKLETAEAEHDHFVELEQSYGYHDAVAIFTAEVWARKLYESIVEFGEKNSLVNFRANFKNTLTNGKVGWDIGRELGEYNIGDELCLVPLWNLDSQNEQKKIHNPSFLRARIIPSTNAYYTSCQTISNEWKFADPDGKTNYIDLGSFKRLYETHQLQLIGIFRDEIFSEKSSFQSTIAPKIPFPPNSPR